MRWSRLMLLVLFLGAFLAAGCPPVPSLGVNQEETIQVAPDDVFQSWGLKVNQAQTMTFTVTSSKAPVDVYVVLEADKAAAQQALKDGKKPTKVLASKTKVTSDTLDNLAVPANTLVSVLLVPTGAATEVKLKATGR